MSEHYFKDIVLPSVGVPAKPSYSLAETQRILDCSQTTVWKMAKRGVINVSPRKRVYYKDLEIYFEEGKNNCPPFSNRK